MILFDKILLIDDEKICNYIASTVLTNAKIAHTVLSFQDAKSALDEIRNNTKAADNELKNLILLDINMPQMNGWEFIEALVQLPENIVEHYRIMMLSSSIDSRDIEKSLSYKSVEKYISKPFSINKLLGNE